MNPVSNKPTWQFPPRSGGADFVQDSASAHFRDAPLRKLVREVIQNSLDAKKSGTSDPVKVAFKETDLAATLIGANELKKHLLSCLKRATDESLTTIQTDYQRALNALESDYVRCLQIVDSGTTGLRGRNWEALVLQEGAVQKHTPSPGGSVGTGKNAVFNVSDLRTVFYGTRYLDIREGRVEKLEGKAVLMSHPDPIDVSKSLQHIGFFAMPDSSPIVIRDIPEPFRLGEVGAGVFVMGFNPRTPEWTKEVTIAAIDNFFYSIHHRKLVVTVSDHDSDEVVIDHERIDSLFSSLAPQHPSRYYYMAIRDTEATQTDSIRNIRRLNVHLSMGSGPSRTAYINRNGMLITDSREQKTNPMAPRRRSLWPDFSAVVIPDSDAGDQWIRKTENPSHDSMSHEQFPEHQDSQEADRSFRRAREAIRKIIDKAAEVDRYGDTSNLSELAAMFPDEFNPSAQGNRELQTTISSTRLPTGSLDADDQAIDIQSEGGQSPGPGQGSRRETDPNPDPAPETEQGPGPRPGPAAGPGRRQARHPRLEHQRLIPTGPSSATVGFTGVEDPPREVKITLTPAGSEYGRENKIEITEATVLAPMGQEVKLEEGVVSLIPRPGERVLIRIATNDVIETLAFRLS